MPENEPQGVEGNDLLLCTGEEEDNMGNLSFWTLDTDPKSSNDVIHPGNPDNTGNFLDSGTSPEYWNGYVFKTIGNIFDGEVSVHVYKVQNGQEIEAGELPKAIGNDLDILSHNAGLVAGKDGNFYKLIGTGNTVVTELVGDIPSIPGIEASYGGYLFAEWPVGNPTKDDQLAILSEDDPTAVASIITLSTGGTSFNSSGVDVDSQTGELVVATQNGFKVAQLPQLDQNGKLPADFSLTELSFSEKTEFKPSQQVDVMKVIASNGYKYFKTSDGKDLIIVTPDNPQTPYAITKSQLGITQNCVPGGCINTILKLESGGIYIIFNDDMDIAPISLTPTADPAEFMAPTLPFKKTTDELSDVTQHIIDNGCTVVTGDKSMFQPAADPCAEDESICDDGNACTTDTCANDNGQAVCDNIPSAGQTCNDEAKCTTNDKCDLNGDCAGTPKTCPAPVNQCEQSAGCDEATGNCQTENKTDGTLCNDGNIGTENDQCVSGICQGAPIVNPEPEPDIVELNPEADVVEQGSDTVEQDNEVVEQEEITTEVTTDIKPGDTGDTTDTEEDVAEDLTGDNSDTGDAAEEDATEDTADNDNANPELDTHDALYVEGEDATEISAETYADTQEVIAAEKDHPKKSPGCGCTTTGVSPDSMSGTLLLGAMLVGLAANMRYKILNALMKRR